MDTENYINILKNPEKIEHDNIGELKYIVNQFPYFQSARVLYLKALKEQESFKYNNELKVTAAYTTDRNVLFNFITAKKFNSTKQNDSQRVKKTDASKEKTTPDTVEKQLALNTPFNFNKNENYSFNQWLQLAAKKPIVRKKAINKSLIIDTFIKNNPKIPRAQNNITPIKITQNEENNQLMTETLAKVYLEQKKYENAIKAYRILSLKYPEKSGFFADQIKRIQILQNLK
ncbi:hypothetical protein [Tenacibaculum sp. UWU-22]|uniref:hypothetical protein n=1 Tax=Tenacibaculum sp. UWU-22 TaxID=3234187 RepID=UPI0034DAE583